MKYFYSGILKQKKVKGILEAESQDEAYFILSEQNIEVLSVRGASFLDEFSEKLNNYKRNVQKVKLQDLIVFTRQFATLFSAGIPIMTILGRLESQTQNERLRGIASEILMDVNAGIPLSSAFGKHKGVFSSLYVNMIRVGEEGGVLDIVLSRLADILEADLDTRNRIKHATRYPKLAVSAIVVAFGVLITFVIPKFVTLFDKFNTALPLPTKILIWINKFTQSFWWLIIGLIVFSVIFFRKYKKTKDGKEKLDYIIFKIPIIGNLVHKIYISRICRILGLLYKSGIPIINSFEIVSEVSGNEIMKKEINNIKIRVSQGGGIANAFEYSKYFPDVVSDMVSAGEDTGRLDEMLGKIADYYDEETEYSIKNLSTAIEPILLVMIAGMVLLLALGVFLPMWDMIKVIK